MTGAPLGIEVERPEEAQDPIDERFSLLTAESPHPERARAEDPEQRAFRELFNLEDFVPCWE